MGLVGVTADPVARPVGRWLDCEVSGRRFKFYPLMSVVDLERQMRIPLSLQFTLRLLGNSNILMDSDVIQFNRVEPALSLLGLKKPKILIIHQNMKVLENKNSDIRWKYLPGLYFKIENFIINRLKEVFIVREDAVVEYQARFPDKTQHIHFLPTWMNPALFYYLDVEEKREQRLKLLPDLAMNEADKLLIFVGRLDQQKDPLYLIDTLSELSKQHDGWKMLMIGDGVLREDVERRIDAHNLGDRVHLHGACSQDEVAGLLRAADLLLLTSAYEGMPRCVVEALGCGVPVVTSKAGEVTLLVDSGTNGYIVEPKDPPLFAEYIYKALNKLDTFKGEPCLKAVEKYRADVVLKKLYDTYRRYAKESV
jgi:glycosyltransferase involved in cell wall biosynthesis